MGGFRHRVRVGHHLDALLWFPDWVDGPYHTGAARLVDGSRHRCWYLDGRTQCQVSGYSVCTPLSDSTLDVRLSNHLPVQFRTGTLAVAPSGEPSRTNR